MLIVFTDDDKSSLFSVGLETHEEIPTLRIIVAFWHSAPFIPVLHSCAAAFVVLLLTSYEVFYLKGESSCFFDIV